MIKQLRWSVGVGLWLALTGLSGCEPKGAAVVPRAPVASPVDRAVGGFLTVASPIDAKAIRVQIAAPARRALTIDHCNGDPGWRLYRLDGSRWQDVWSGEADACASAPIRIDAGADRVFDLANYNGMRPPLAAGRYQLVLHPLRWDHAEQVEQSLRRSNVFEVVAPTD